MRWWLQTNPPYLMSVDNATVMDMDYSALLATTPDLWMVQWADGKGEIERLEIDENNEAQNLNGLREPFIDITPYAPLFQQFLTLLKAKALLLQQAKQVQSDLIREIFESKRQAPYHYPVAAGDYWWDATDATLSASTAAGLQSTIAKLNTVIDKLNALIPSINAVDAGITSGVNSQMTTINTGISAIGNLLISQINTGIVDPHNNALNTYTPIGDALVTYINGTVLSIYGGISNSVNYGLRSIGTGIAPAGITADIAHTAISWANPYSATAVAPGTFNNVSAIASGGPIAWTDITHVPAANTQWIPIGATAPVNVTPAEQAAIQAGIAARTNDLNVKKNTKLGQVNALTDIDAVIAYDVTTGW